MNSQWFLAKLHQQFLQTEAARRLASENLIGAEMFLAYVAEQLSRPENRPARLGMGGIDNISIILRNSTEVLFAPPLPEYASLAGTTMDAGAVPVTGAPTQLTDEQRATMEDKSLPQPAQRLDGGML